MSGRIRSIKPEWLEDELMAFASSDARVLSIALLLLADDYGNGRCTRSQLAARVFPSHDDSDEGLATSSRRFREALEELSTMRFVGLYEVERQHYFTIRNWSKHQRVDKPSKPLVPCPPETLWSHSRDTRETLAPDLDQEGKGIDRKGEEPRALVATPTEPNPGYWPTQAEVTAARQRLEGCYGTECPDELAPNETHQKLAQRIGEPLDELWAMFRAKRRAAGSRAAMPRGWEADFEGWLRTFARNEVRARSSPQSGMRANEHPGTNRARGQPELPEFAPPDEVRAERRRRVAEAKKRVEEQERQTKHATNG